MNLPDAAHSLGEPGHLSSNPILFSHTDIIPLTMTGVHALELLSSFFTTRTEIPRFRSTQPDSLDNQVINVTRQRSG